MVFAAGGEAFSNRQQTAHGIHRSRAGSVALALMLCWSGSVCTETFNQFLKIPTCARGLGRLVGRHPEQKQEAREGGESVVPFRSARTVSIVPALASSFLHLLQVPALSQPIGVHPPYLARSWRARRCISRRVFPTSPEFSCHSFHVPWEKEGLGVSWRHENHRSRLSCTEVDHVFGLAPRQKRKGKKKVSAAFDKKGSKNNHLACCWRRSAGQSDGRGFGHTSVSVSRLVRFLWYTNFPPKTRHVWMDRCREILPLDVGRCRHCRILHLLKN